MSNTPNESLSGSFSDPSQAARLRDILGGIIEAKVDGILSTRMTGMILDIYQGGPTFNSEITVDSTVIPRTEDNPAQPYVALIRCDDKFEGRIIEARIDPNYIPIFRKAEFFDEENPSGSGVMVDRLGRYVTVATVDGVSSVVTDSYPSLTGTTLLAPQVAPRVAVEGNAASWRVTELIRGVLSHQVNPGTLMVGPDYASFDTSTLTWGGTIAFARGSIIKSYEIYPDAPIVTYGSDPLEVSATAPVEIVLGQRSGSMYLNFSATDGIPVLVWVEADSDIPIPPEWYLVFARINNGSISSKLLFASMTDFRSPSAPGDFLVTYAKTGYEKYGLTASWDAVTEGTNGDPIQVSTYELWGEVSGEDWRRITTTTELSVSGLSFDADTTWNFKARAVGSNGIPGVFTSVQSINFPEDTTPLGGGTTTYWQATKPTGGKAGDEWFDTSSGNKHYIFDATANDFLEALFGGQAIADAAIGNAQINSLSVAKLTGDTMTANVNIAGKFEAGSAGAGQVILDATGIRVKDWANIQQTAFNTTGSSVFKGDIEAAGIEAYGPVKMHSLNNEISSGAALVIAGGVTAPTTAPQVVPDWDVIQLTFPTADGALGVEGIAFDSTNNEWLSLVQLNSNLRFRAYRHNLDGTYKSTVGTWADDSSGSYAKGRGLAYVNGELWRSRYSLTWVSSTTSYTYAFQVVKLDGTVKTVASVAGMGSNANAMVIGSANNTTQLTAMYMNGNAYTTGFNLCLFTLSSSAKSSIITTGFTGSMSGSYYITDPQGICYGALDGGTARYWNINSDFSQVVRMISTAGAVQTAEYWDAAVLSSYYLGIGPSGFPFAGGYAGTIYIHPGPQYVSGSEPVFTYTWADTKSAGTGTHESAQSPVSSTAAPRRRARLLVITGTPTIGAGDDDVDAVRVYGAKGTATQRYQQALGPSNYFEITSIATSGTKPGDINSFPLTNPGSLRTANNENVIPGVGPASLLGINVPYLLGSSNLNSLTQNGMYCQYTDADATLARNYPIPKAGLLENFYNSVYSGNGWQRYSTVDNLVFHRVMVSGVWGTWGLVGGATRGFKAWITASFSLATSGHNKVTGYTEIYDTDAGFNPTTGNFVIPTGLPGIWALVGAIPFSSSATGRRFLQFEQGTAAAGNAANTVLLRQELSGAYVSPAIYTEVPFTGGETVFLNAYQTSGAAMTSPSANTPTVFSATYKGPSPV